MFTPLHDVIYMKPIEEDKTSGGIYLTKRPEGTAKAKVIFVGTGSHKYPKPTTVKCGDIVAVMTGMVEKKTIEGEDYIVAHEKDIFGVYDAA